jgi:hypothetical protein
MGPAVPQDQHLSDASEGEKVSTRRVTTSTEKLLRELESTLEKIQFQTNRFNSPDS